MAYGRVRMTGSARVPEFWLGWERVADRRKVAENWRAVAAMLLASDVGQPEAQEDLEYVQQFDIGLRQRLRLLPRQDLAAVESLRSTGGKAVAEGSSNSSTVRASMEPGRRHGHQCREQNQQHNEDHLGHKVRHRALRGRLH